MGPKDIYLVLYNVFCCAGWSLVCLTAFASVYLDLSLNPTNISDALTHVYFTGGLATLLSISQTSAILEIVHAMFRLVRSPVMVTAMQVGSRIVALVAVVFAPSAQGKLLMVTCVDGV
jgi:very-long-chain (3R)-3-hydroxyacyl-CoA dehydratase